MGLYLDKNCEETLVDSFSEKSYYVPHNVGVRFPCIEGDFPSPIHFWEEERKQAEPDRRITGFLSCCLLESSSARQAAPSLALLEKLPSSPLPSWQQPPLCSSSLKKPAPMIPLSFDPSVAYTDPEKLQMPRSPASVPDLFISSRGLPFRRRGVFFVVLF